jgi:hypothetical protein
MSMDIPHPKRRGEWAELRFMQRVSELGLWLTKPWGDSAPYDFITDHRGHLVRVQVKCTHCRRGKSYKCNLSANGVPYTPDQIDLFAAYVIPTDSWYLLPLKATHHQPEILLTPHNPKSKYSRYKEAWHLLMR